MQVTEAFWEMFLVVVQLGAILAVVVIFWGQIFPFSFKKGEPLLRRDIWSLWFKILVACVPACVYAFVLDDIVEPYLYNYITVAAALILYGVLFILIERHRKNHTYAVETTDALSVKKAFSCSRAAIVLALRASCSASQASRAA